MGQETYEFVKATKRDLYFKTRDKEIRYLLNKATGRIKGELAEYIEKCLLCGSKKRQEIFRKDGFSFYRCVDCSFIYADPQIREDRLMESYRGSSANDLWIDVLLSETNLEYDIKKYSRGLEKIESVIGGAGKILDVGCSVGTFLKIAEDRNWESLGLEINEKAIEYAYEKWGLKIKKKLLNDASFSDNSFDAVTMWGVIEHLKNPLQVISEIGRILRPGGVLLTFCPNVESLACRVLHENTSCIDGRNHCGYYSPQTLTYLLNHCGFEVLEIESHQPELDTVLNHMDFDPPYLKDTDGANSVKELFGANMIEQLESIILERTLGYKMMTLARRK